jgi:hypothetical protein
VRSVDNQENELRANTIDMIIEALRECWHENPDFRLGQLIINIGESDDLRVIYNMNDNLWMKNINCFRKEMEYNK